MIQNYNNFPKLILNDKYLFTYTDNNFKEQGIQKLL
jgi:hypothetical protein